MAGSKERRIPQESLSEALIAFNTDFSSFRGRPFSGSKATHLTKARLLTHIDAAKPGNLRTWPPEGGYLNHQPDITLVRYVPPYITDFGESYVADVFSNAYYKREAERPYSHLLIYHLITEGEGIRISKEEVLKDMSDKPLPMRTDTRLQEASEEELVELGRIVSTYCKKEWKLHM